MGAARPYKDDKKKNSKIFTELYISLPHAISQNIHIRIYYSFIVGLSNYLILNENDYIPTMLKTN